MSVHIALLRAVNVGGSTPVQMAALRALLTQMGFGEVRSLLHSGNLVFGGGSPGGSSLEPALEAAIAKRFALQIDVFVRTASEWHTIVAQNPFPREAEQDPGRLVVTVLKGAPSATAWKGLDAAIRGPEVVRGVGRHAYIVYPEGTGRSRLTLALIERQLGTRGTSRNWNTVTKLDVMASRTDGQRPPSGR
jgi:uncharacterized protein (DUF1697 family)